MNPPRYVYSTVEAYGERAVVGTCQWDAMDEPLTRAPPVREGDFTFFTPAPYLAMTLHEQPDDWYPMAWYLSQLGDA